MCGRSDVLPLSVSWSIWNRTLGHDRASLKDIDNPNQEQGPLYMGEPWIESQASHLVLGFQHLPWKSWPACGCRRRNLIELQSYWWSQKGYRFVFAKQRWWNKRSNWWLPKCSPSHQSRPSNWQRLKNQPTRTRQRQCRNAPNKDPNQRHWEDYQLHDVQRRDRKWFPPTNCRANFCLGFNPSLILRKPSRSHPRNRRFHTRPK